jgi:hypothetical protein
VGTVRAPLVHVVAPASSGHVRAHVEQFPLINVQTAYDTLRSGTCEVAPIVIPGLAA